MSRTLGLLAPPQNFSTEGLLVGMLVANQTLLVALAAHGGFETICFFIGERSEAEAVRRLDDALGGARLVSRSILELPRALERHEIDALHLPALSPRLGPAVQLRNLHARRALPVTAQIHSLSYPRTIRAVLDLALAGFRATDAVFCSSTAGRDAVIAAFGLQRERLAGLGLRAPAPPLHLPVIPLGVDVAALRQGDRDAGRARLGLPTDAFVVLSIGRFSEYDKMDLFPVVRAIAERAGQREPDAPPLRLVLAGAAQGTTTARQVELWATLLGVADALVTRVDFPESEKADLLAAADVFVSLVDNPQETFGLSVVEAMAAGLPVIVSDFDGYRDTVPEGVGVRVATRWNAPPSHLDALGGLLYERPLHLLLGQSIEVDVPAVVRALRVLEEAPERRRQMGASAAAHAHRFAWPAVIGRMDRVWQELAGQPDAPRGTGVDLQATDYRRVFERFPTGWRDAGRRLVRSPHAERLGPAGHPIMADLRSVFDDAAAQTALEVARTPVTQEALETAAATALFDGERWRAALLVAWLIKQGLLIDAGGR